MKLAPSLLSADLADLAGALRLCEEGGAQALHFDVIDGHFAPNLTFGIPVLKAIAPRTELPIDVHLMVERPGDLLDQWMDAGADWLSVHWEATVHLDRQLSRIRERGKRAGVALNPTTPVEVLVDTLPLVDFVLLMSVNPGFSGQSFLPQSLDKARRLRRMLDERGLEAEIEMDGGIGADNIHQVVEAGVDICVAGSAVFGATDPVEAMRTLHRGASAGVTTRSF